MNHGLTKSKFAHAVLDFYDDEGSTLKAMFPTPESLPEVIKTAAVLQRESVPLEKFAFVATENGLRLTKYACNDAGTTAMSVIYFMEHGSKLPVEAQKLAAANLVSACVAHGILPPEPLTKVASGETKVAGVLDRFHKMVGNAATSAGEAAARGASGVMRENMVDMGRSAIRHGAIAAGTGAATGALMSDDDIRDGALRGALGGLAGGATGFAVKPNMATLAGSAVLAGGVAGKLGRTPAVPVRVVDDHKASMPWDNQAYDLSGAQPPIYSDRHGSMNHLVEMDGRQLYPVDTYDQVKTAVDYWELNNRRMDPEIRRQYAVKLAARAEALVFPIPNSIKEAGSPWRAYSDNLKIALEMRKVAFERKSEAAEFLDELFEKRASLDGDMFAECLRRFDVQTGIDKGWDVLFPDPWQSTFGMDKKAEEAVWQDGAERVTKAQLENLALNYNGDLHHHFHDSFTDDFKKDPMGIFHSMPLPQKKIIARLANDTSSQGGYEPKLAMDKEAISKGLAQSALAARAGRVAGLERKVQGLNNLAQSGVAGEAAAAQNVVANTAKNLSTNQRKLQAQQARVTRKFGAGGAPAAPVAPTTGMGPWAHVGIGGAAGLGLGLGAAAATSNRR